MPSRLINKPEASKNNISDRNILGRLPLYRHWGSVQAVRPIGGVEVYLYHFLTTALEEGEGSASRPGCSLPPGKTRYPLYRRLGGPQDRSGQVRKILPPLGFDPRTVQPVASRYTDCATRPTLVIQDDCIYWFSYYNCLLFNTNTIQTTYKFQFYGSYSATPMTCTLTDTHTRIHMQGFLSVCYYRRVNIFVSNIYIPN
jgi:hypothetical protein